MTEHVDVLIVGAGLSGIGAADHLRRSRPGATYVILEAREEIGGTWDLFRYPGVRSDSDMQTLGYRLRPWTGDKSIADGQSILSYVRDTAREAGIDKNIRFGHRVVSMDWSWRDARWTVEAEHNGAQIRFTAGFLQTCTGYYRYDRGHSPEFPGIKGFRGQVVHPQLWPDNLDWAGKKVVVVGSGATAVTLVPALAEKAALVTMLQRSPSYIARVPARDGMDLALRRFIGDRRAYPITRWKNIVVSLGSYAVSKRFPEFMKGVLRKDLEKQLPSGFDIDTHFSPRYGPWDERLCAAPDGDIFEVISDGRADVVTDRIDTFTETGIRLASGRELEADVVVTATGLEMLFLGGATMSVDGREVRPPERIVYKGLMLDGVPNFAFAFGYTNSSWTLRADLVHEYVCRLLEFMADRGYRTCVPVPSDQAMDRGPLLGLSSGYVRRGLSQLPSSGTKAPWRMGNNYLRDLVTLRHGRLDDGNLLFGAPVPRREPVTPRSEHARSHRKAVESEGRTATGCSEAAVLPQGETQTG